MKSFVVALALASLTAGCGGRVVVDDGAGAGAGDGTGGAPGTGGGPLQPPDHGMQLASEPITLAPGDEKYLCWSSLVADGGIQVTGLDYQTPGFGIHHYAIFTNSVPPPDDPSAYECSNMGPTWGFISGGGLGTPPVDFPSGTAMTLPAQTHVLLQLHMLNTTGKPLTVDPVRVNLVGAAPGTKLEQVGVIFAGTIDIHIPPHATGAVAKGGCPAPNAMEHVFDVFPHMHRLGRRIQSTLAPAAGGPVDKLADIAWNFSDQALYDVHASAKAGDQIEVKCTYDNTSDQEVKFGLSTTDEMCIEALYYWPATTLSQYCGL